MIDLLTWQFDFLSLQISGACVNTCVKIVLSVLNFLFN